MGLLKHYWVDLLITTLVFLAVAIWGSPLMLFPVAILLIIEVAFSFDNAIVNARVLVRLNPLWQKLFLTVGMIIAVLGMRLIFPIAIVAITAKIPFGQVASLAINNSIVYGEKLSAAHHLIDMFSGVYLLLIFLDFFFEERDVRWFKKLEAGLAKLGQVQNLSYIFAGVFIIIASYAFGGSQRFEMLVAGFASLLVYIVVSLVSKLFAVEDEQRTTKLVRHGWAAFALFIYLEIQDSAFSFDNVSAAFAITSNVILIAVGLGVGALFVRSITVRLVRTGQLTRYRYLEHGAHWAIGALAVCLLVGIGPIAVPEYIVGLTGIVFIGAAFFQSRNANKRDNLNSIKIPQI